MYKLSKINTIDLKSAHNGKMITNNTVLTLFRNMNQFSNCLEFYWLVNIVPNPQMINC